RTAESGATTTSRNPATGATIATIAEAGAPDIDRAVAAARRAFDGGWARSRPYERQRLLGRLAAAIESQAEESALLETLDMGAPIVRARASIASAVQMLRWFAA